MRAIVIGTGFVAQAYLRVIHYLGFHPLVLSRSWFNYHERRDLDLAIKSYRPDVLINCAGYTGRTVDDCEINKAECEVANVDLPFQLALACGNHDVKFVHISTGCMFEGGSKQHQIAEDVQPFFLDNAYQNSKWRGERAVWSATDLHWIFRIRMPFSQFWHPHNWLTKLAEYEKILDGLNSATWIDEFAMRSWQLVERGNPGTYHSVQPGPVWTLDVARALHHAGLRSVYPLLFSAEDYRSFLKSHVRRSNAVLDPTKFEETYRAKGTPAMSAIQYCIDQLVKTRLPDKTPEASEPVGTPGQKTSG